MFVSIIQPPWNSDSTIYQLIDTDFTANLVLGDENKIAEYRTEDRGYNDFDIGLEDIISIGSEYEHRGLNVAANLVLYFRWVQQEYSHYNVDYILRWNNIHYPELAKEFYGKYVNDIKRYMVLI